MSLILMCIIFYLILHIYFDGLKTLRTVEITMKFSAVVLIVFSVLKLCTISEITLTNNMVLIICQEIIVSLK